MMTPLLILKQELSLNLVETLALKSIPEQVIARLVIARLVVIAQFDVWLAQLNRYL